MNWRDLPAASVGVRRAPVLFMAAALLGCADSSGYLDPGWAGSGAQGLTVQLTNEADALMRLLGFGQILVAALLLTFGWLAVRLVQSGILLVWRLGMDAKRRLAPLRSAANMLIVGAVGYLLLRRFLVAAPLLTLGALALCSSAALIVLAKPIQNVWAGFLLSFRRGIREGDRATVGKHTGIVQDVGMTRLHLRSADGATLLVPNHVVLRETLRVEQAKNTVPVTVRIPAHQKDPGPELVRMARRSALLSPFRAPGTAIEVEVVDEGTIQVVVQVWSERAVREGKAQLEVQLRASLATDAPPSSAATERLPVAVSRTSG